MNNIKTLLFFILALTSFSLLAAAVQDKGETINRRGTVADDYYAAGGTILVDANVRGDVVVAGGTVTVGDDVGQDAIIAGGTLTLLGKVRDDVRIAGGTITIDANIGDDLLAAGGNIEISPGALISGDAYIAGGNVSMNGTVNGNLSVGSGHVEISGRVRGNVYVEAGEVELEEGARIDGNLTYKSPRKAEISSQAVVRGKVSYTEMERYQPDRGYVVIPLITLSVAGIVLLMVFPNFTQAASARVSTGVWKNLGLGFAILVATPVAAIIMMALVVGLHVGLPLLFIYFVTLLIAFLIGAFFVANYGAQKLSFDSSTRGRQIAAFLAAMVVLALLRLVPVLGGLIIFLLLITALGATVQQVYGVYRGGKNVIPARKKKTTKKKKTR